MFSLLALLTNVKIVHKMTLFGPMTQMGPSFCNKICGEPSSLVFPSRAIWKFKASLKERFLGLLKEEFDLASRCLMYIEEE